MAGVAALAALAASGCLAACGGSPAPHLLATPKPTLGAVTGESAPALQVLRLVPSQATELTVTDFEQLVKPVDWATVDAHEPLLTRGLLRDAHHQDQVLWEAHWDGGGVAGWAVLLADGANPATLAPAGSAVDGQLVTQGAATGASWADDASVASLVQDDPLSTYVAKGCVPGDPDPSLQPLDGYALELTERVATARLSTGRTDLFDRMRMASAVPAFEKTFTGGVADPVSGRIGYQLTDPAQAVQLALTHKLPFAVCGS